MKVLVVGYGSIGQRHIENISYLKNVEILVQTKRKYDKILKNKCSKILHSLSAAINEKPDVAIISNVTSQHMETAIKLAQSKVDIFLEKPISNSLSGMNTLLNLIKKNNLITQVGCQFRFHQCIVKIKEIIDNDEIGRVISVKVECGSYLPDWHPYEDYRKSYAARNDLGGGVVLTCIHEIDYLYWLFGDVEEVFSITGKFSDLKINADDLSTIIMCFKNKIIAEVHLDYFQKPAIRSCKVIGTKGIIYWDSDSNTVKLYDFHNDTWKTKFKMKKYDRNILFVKEVEHFFQSVKERKETINPIQTDGVKTLKIALAILKSAKNRKIVKL
ncbi:MAG: Gfo/Idh/MocA family oxidoreductase [Nitrosotalea sp.]